MALAVALIGSVGGIVAGIGGLDLFQKSKACRDPGDTDYDHGRIAAIVGITLGCLAIVGIVVVSYFVVARWHETIVQSSGQNIRDLQAWRSLQASGTGSVP